MAKKTTRSSKLEAQSSQPVEQKIPPITILTFTPVWKRPDVFAVALEGIKRLVSYAPERFKIIPFFIVSEGWAARAVFNAGFDFMFAQNHPLGNKKNIGLKYALENFRFDYLMEIGSDDIMLNSYLDLVEPEMRSKTPQFCPSTIWFADVVTGKTARYYSPEKICGLGRTLSRTTIEKVHNAALWNPEGDRGMDTFSWRHLLSKYETQNKVILIDEIMMLDIKSSVNINEIEKFTISDLSFDEVVAPFPEAQQLKNILQKARSPKLVARS